MILHLDPGRQVIAILSLPRDLWVQADGYEHYVKLNAAYTLGEEAGGPAAGAATARATVSAIIGQPIDYTLVTTFEGFINIVDHLGGVDVDVPTALFDPSFPTFDYGYTTAEFAPGPQTMDGTTALTYSRTRHPDNDFERGRRQQLVILALFTHLHDLLASGDLSGALNIASAVEPEFEYTDLDALTALQVAQSFPTFDPAAVRRESIDLRYGVETSTIDGAYIIMPDLQAIQHVASEVFGQDE